MRNNEDYLDSLLNNVTKKLSEFDEDFEQKKQASDAYMTKKNLPPKTMKALETVRENQFLREFEDELKQEDADSFLAAFEAELEGEAEEFERTKEAQSADDDEYMDQIDELLRASSTEPEADDDLLGALELDDPSDDLLGALQPDDDDDLLGALEPDTGDDLLAALESGKEEASLPDESEETLSGDPFSELPNLDAFANLTTDEPVDAPPEGMEALENLFDSTDDLGDLSSFGDLDMMNGGTDGEKILPEDEEPILPEDDEELDDEGILNLLNGMSEDEALSDIGKMLEADEQSISLEDLGADPENLTHAADLAESKKSAAGAKKQKKRGFFAKLLDLLFGEDEEDAGEVSAVSETEDLDGISDENLDILRAMEGDVLTEPEEKSGKKKKKKKEKKKKEPKEPKEKKQKEPKEKKPKKPKKEKKPAEAGKREKPLPRGPVIMIWLLAISVFALVYIGNNLLSHSNALSMAQQCFDRGDYVQSYEEFAGIKVGSSETELYERAKVLSGVQTELKAYYSMMEVRKFDLALDCLVRALGRADLHMAEAEEWGVTTQMNALISETTMQLMDQFNVTEEQARELYALDDRDEYSLAIDEVLTGLGLK